MSRGLFITGTDTDVGKTAVAVAIVGQLRGEGRSVGVCKPVASGVADDGGDPRRLWEAAGRPRSLGEVCPQAFTTPIAPARAAAAEGRTVDDSLLMAAVTPWLATSECVIVEGAGGLFSPLSSQLLNLDLARHLGLPLVVCDDARLGAIGRTLAVVTAARAEGVKVAAVVLSQVRAPGSASTLDPTSPEAIARAAAEELAVRLPAIPIGTLAHAAERITPAIDWLELAG
jgi:dethiobiotin synthetase